MGKQVFELSNHLGNVLATITDKKLQVSLNSTSTAYFEADVQTVQDYYAFGMQMPGRKLSGGYRYGFNGKENDNDNEVKGEGNQQDYGMRIYDGRIGKFLSVDPLTKNYPWYTPYQFAGNKPIWAADLDGMEEWMKTQESLLRQKVELQHQVAENRKLQVVKQAMQAMAQAPTLSPSDNCYAAQLKSNEFKQQQRFNDNMRGATMDPLAANMAYPMANAIGQYTKNTIQHGYGIYNGIKESEYGDAAKNAGLFALDVAPFISFKGSNAANTLEQSFTSGGTKLMSTTQIAKYPTSSTFGKIEETFISPTTEIDAMLSSGISRVEIAKRLGIQDQNFLKGDLIRIDIAPASLKNLKLRSATGSEAGANELFIPGGKTSGGITEGIVNGIPKTGKGVKVSNLSNK